MPSYLSQLTVDLKEAADRGIISPEQMKKVWELAESHRSSQRIRSVVLMAILSGLFVVAGVSLIVAHNWDKIPAVVKVLSFLGLLAGAGELTLWFDRRNLTAAVPLQVLWFFMPLIGIGLYAQVFQLSGDPVRPFLVWLLLTLPMAWLRPVPILAFIHLLASMVVLLKHNFSAGNHLTLVSGYWNASPVSPWAWGLSLMILAIIGLETIYGLQAKYRHYVVGGVLLWANLLFWSGTSFQIRHAGLICIAGLASATIWLLVCSFIGTPDGQRRLPRLAWVGVLYAATFFWHERPSSMGSVAPWGLALILALVAGALVMIYRLPAQALSPDSRWQQAAQRVLAFSFLVLVPLMNSSATACKTVAVLANILLVGVGVAMIWHGAGAAKMAQVNFGVALLFLILVTRFIDVVGNFLQGGMAFICAGLGIGALAYALQRSRQMIMDRMEAQS